MAQRRVDGQRQPRAYDTREYKRVRAELLVPGALCWLCGLAIDFTVPPRHPMSPSLDHVVPLAKGGHPTARENARPAHFGCNSSKQDKQARPMPLKRSRAW